MHVSSTQGVTVALHDLGGDGPPLIICHATGFHGRTYEPFARLLTGSYHVWAIDFRGHGASTPPDDENFDWVGMADDLLASIDAIGGGPVYAVGHSLGGATVLRAAHREPDAVAKAYLYEPIVMPLDWERPAGENRMADPARRRREVFGSRGEALMRYAIRTPLGVLRADCLAAYVEHGFVDIAEGGVRLACRSENEARTFEASGTVTLSMAAEVDMPVVVGAGGAPDPGSMAVLALGLVEALPQGRMVVYEHLGHFGPLQDPITIARDVLAAFA